MFFQNVFDRDFIGDLILGERGYTVDFKVKANQNNKGIMASYNSEPYDLSSSGNRNLTINYAIDESFLRYASLSINVSGATAASTTATEVATALNANATFASLFQAFADPYDYKNPDSARRVVIRTLARNISVPLRYYVSNTSAETKLQFNRFAGVNEIPIYFNRHTIANRNNSGSLGHLIALSHLITGISSANPSVITSAGHGLTTGDSILIVNSNSDPSVDGAQTVTVVDGDTFTVPVSVSTAGNNGQWMSVYEQTMITNAGFTPSALKEDWQLLAGRSVLFTFRKNTVDSNSRITETIEYQAGASVGDLAKKITYTYSSTYTNPDTYAEVPYILRSGDMITP